MGLIVSLCFLSVCSICFLVTGVEEDRHQNKIADTTKLNAEPSIRPFDITFNLYTRKNPTIGQDLLINDTEKLKNTNFDANKTTKFITHGYFDIGNGATCSLIRDVYLSHTDCNVLIVDWSKYSFGLYQHAVNATLAIGQEIARMIDFLHEQGGLDTERSSLVGYSLGAQVIGIAGYHTKYKVKYVFGLDPALPGFFWALPGISISKESGKHVQIIHTNGGFLGYLEAYGHSDFFPNGGSKQPGCGILFINFCSHDRVYRFFAESITRPFNGTMCNSYESFEAGDCRTDAYVAPMGDFDPDRVLPGKYYLRTGSKPPYSVV